MTISRWVLDFFVLKSAVEGLFAPMRRSIRRRVDRVRRAGPGFLRIGGISIALSLGPGAFAQDSAVFDAPQNAWRLRYQNPDTGQRVNTL